MKTPLANKFIQSKNWDDEDLFFCGSIELRQLGLSPQDSDLFERGIPRWVAPNMHLFPPVPDTEGFIAIGEDRDDRKILLSVSTGEVFVASQSILIYASSSLSVFLNQIIHYAEMVDKALKINGRNTLIDNNLPDDCINQFEWKISQIDPKALLDNSFWSQELSRLRNRNNR